MALYILCLSFLYFFVNIYNIYEPINLCIFFFFAFLGDKYSSHSLLSLLGVKRYCARALGYKNNNSSRSSSTFSVSIKQPYNKIARTYWNVKCVDNRFMLSINTANIKLNEKSATFLYFVFNLILNLKQ